jgi:two-component system OmpR family sensor kinase
VIEDLLFLARADSGSDELQFETLDLSSVIRDASEEFELVARSAGVSVSASAVSGCAIRGDAEAMHRLVLILLDNAIKFTPRGGAVQVSLDTTPSNPPFAELQVSDTGVGIAVDDLAHVFDRFYRVSKDRSRTTGGAGLGLSIARWIVASHRGRIDVQSTPGAGSTFTVRLPLA